MKTKIKFLSFLFFIVIFNCINDDTNEDTTTNDLSHIQGDWFRVGGNNLNNNGMKISVNDDQGILEEPALSNFHINDIKWADILQTDGNLYAHRELGSNYNYFEATMELGTDDTLRINVANSGLGNIQKWVRAFIEPATEQNDCVEYEEEGFSDGQNENWSDYNDFDTYSSLLATPGEPGGGYFTFAIANDEIAPGLNIKSSSDSSGAIFAASSAGTTDPNSNQAAFLAHPNISYDIRVNIAHGTVSSYPLEYGMNWTFVPAEDCFEPNNTLQEAKAIPKDETLEAFGIAGHISNYVSSGDENTYDYYKITTQAEGKIRFTLENCPSDIWISCSLREPSGAQINGQYTTIIGDTTTNQAGSTYYYQSSGTWPAGTYYVRLQMNGATSVDLNTESIPQFWGTPYLFKVSLIQ